MNEIILVDLPKAHGEITGAWYSGYPVHKGRTKNSLNYATVYAHNHHVIPDQKVMRREYNKFISNFKTAGLKIHLLPFPNELNQIDSLHHDGIFIRDVGMMYKNYWIKASFSARVRQPEADVWAPIIAKKFKKQIITPPKDAYIEFGEAFFLETNYGTYYFGGLSRSNKKGHDFVRSIIKPAHYCLIKSNGYHLDTVFSPVVDKNNNLTAFIVAKNMISKNSLLALKKLGGTIIYVNSMDSSGHGNILGNYTVNTFTAPGLMMNCGKFSTPGVENKLKALKIKRYSAPLTYFRFAGGSYHCLTNEIYT